MERAPHWITITGSACGYDEPRAFTWGSLVNNGTGHCPCSGNLRLRISPQSPKSCNRRRHTSECDREPHAAYPEPAAYVVGTRREDQWATSETVAKCTNSHHARGYSSNPGTG